MPSIFGKLTSWLGTPQPVREQRRQLRAMESQYAEKMRRLTESYEIADTLINPLERWMDGDKLYIPYGTVNDRRQGSYRPILTTEQDLRLLRSQSRLLCDTNQFAIGFLDRLTDFTIGDGMAWNVTLAGQKTGSVSTGVVDADGDGTPDVDPVVSQCQQVLDEWKELNEWGDGEEDREAEAFKRWRRDGNVFLRFFRGGPETDGLPIVRFVEPEQITAPSGAEVDYSWGVLTEPEDVETRVEYYAQSMEGYSTDGERIPASRMLHLKCNTDRTVKMGVPDFAPVFQDMERCRKLLSAMGEVSTILAKIAYIRQHAPGVTETQIHQLISDESDLSARGTDLSARGTNRRGGAYDRTFQTKLSQMGEVLDVSEGMQHIPAPSATGIPGWLQVEQAMLRGASSRWGMPEFFSGDASNNNYASILVSGGPFERATKRRQREFAGFSKCVAIKVLSLAEEAGRLPRGATRRVKVQIVPQSVSIASPLQDEQIREIRARNKVLSVQTWQSEVGLDPNIESANIQAQADANPPQQGFDPMGGMGGGFGESIDWFTENEAAGFTGELTDTVGRKRHYVNGKQVAKNAIAAGKIGVGKAKAAAGKVDAAVAASKLGVPYKFLKKGIHRLEQAMMVGMVRTQAIAKRAAEHRGLPAEHIEKVGRVMAAGDFALSFASSKVAATVTGGNLIAGYAAGMMPTASLAYLTYSTARNPLATLKAARDYAKGELQIHKPSTHEAMSDDDATLIYEYITAHEGDDWAVAVLLSSMDAMAHGLSIKDAIEVADKVMEKHDDPSEAKSEARLYRRLEEAGFTGTVIDKLGRKRNYVDGKQVAKAKPGAKAKADPVESASKATALLTSTKAIGASGLQELSRHLAALPVAKLKEIQAAYALKGGKVKADRVDRLVAFASGRDSVLATLTTNPAIPKAEPKPKKEIPASVPLSTEGIQTAVDAHKELLKSFKGGGVPETNVRQALSTLDKLSGAELYEVAKQLNADATLSAKSPRAKILKQITEMVLRALKTSDNVNH